MKKFLVIAVVFIITFALAGLAVASMNVLEFKDGAMGPVTFDGKMHNQKLGAGKCMECHKGNFPMKKPGTEGSAKITMADINAGKFCGACHNGTKAFSAKEAANCGKCHKKK